MECPNSLMPPQSPATREPHPSPSRPSGERIGASKPPIESLFRQPKPGKQDRDEWGTPGRRGRPSPPRQPKAEQNPGWASTC
ncbi:hypothetical protein LY76DRAFT_598400 [Colletotrichum caudatum]|nr:hypothetical protein LY76DRAFT_598400 [Colletotrichum caudatum]